VSEDDGGMQYWQQLGQQEEQEFINQETKSKDVENGQPAPVKSGILRSNCDGIYSKR